QPRPQIVDVRVGAVPSQPRILNDVLGVGDGSGESIPDSQQMRPQFLELVDARAGGHEPSLGPVFALTSELGPREAGERKNTRHADREGTFATARANLALREYRSMPVLFGGTGDIAHHVLDGE